MRQGNLTVTNSAQAMSALWTTAPQSSDYVQICNPSATASIAFTIDGSSPVVNGNGITIAPLGSETFDHPAGVGFPVGALKLISSVASQSVTILLN